MYFFNENKQVAKDSNLMNLLAKNGNIYQENQTLYLKEDGELDSIAGPMIVQLAKWEKKTGWKVENRNESLQAILNIHEFSSIIPKKYWDPRILIAIATGKEVKIKANQKIIGVINDCFDSQHNQAPEVYAIPQEYHSADFNVGK